MLRQLLAVHETRGLYDEVARSAEARRTLLAEVLQSVDDDRRLVAAQLHEQAASSYGAFASMCTPPRSDERPASRFSSGPRASDLLRTRLAAQAESLRELTAAIQPLNNVPGREGPGFVDPGVHRQPLRGGTRPLGRGAGGRRPLPRLDHRDGGVARLVQEAIRNVWRHAAASCVVIDLTGDDEAVTVTIVDDGIGFDPDSGPQGVRPGRDATLRRLLRRPPPDRE